MALGDQLGKLTVGVQVDLSELTRGLAEARAVLKAAQASMSSDANRWSTDVQKATGDVEKAWAKFARATGDRREAITADLAQIRAGFEQLGQLAGRALNDLADRFPVLRRAVNDLRQDWNNAVGEMRTAWNATETAVSRGLRNIQGLFAPVARASSGLGSAFSGLRLLAERELSKIGALVSPIGRAFDDVRVVVDRQITAMLSRLNVFGVALKVVQASLAPWGAAFKATFTAVGSLMGDLAVVAGTRLVAAFGRLGAGAGGLVRQFTPLAAAARAAGTAMDGAFGDIIKRGAQGLGQAFGSLGQALARLNVPLLGVSGVFKGLGAALEATPALLIPVIGLLALLGNILVPLVVTLVAATFIIGGFVVGLGALLATVGIAGAILGGLGVAVVALASATNGWNNVDKQTHQAQTALNKATKDHQTAVESLQRAQVGANQTHHATALQMFDLATAQQRVATTGGRLAQLQDQIPPLQRNVAAATKAHQTAVNALAAAQNSVTTATNTHNNALRGLSRSQLIAGTVTGPTALQTLNLSIAQNHAAGTAQQLAQAQNLMALAVENSFNPLETFKRAWDGVGKTWGEQVTPLAGQILFWLASMAPLIQDVGTDLFTWLGPRMGNFINQLGLAFDTLFQTLRPFGKELGEWIDKVLARSPAFQFFFGLFVKFGESTIMGLLNNLLRLSDWFIAIWPTMGPAVAQIFSAIGSAVQWVGQGLGKMVTWFVNNWPQIIKWVSETWGEFSKVVAWLGPLIILVWQTINAFLQVQDTLPGLRDLAFIAGILVVVAMGAVVIGVGAVVVAFLGLAIVTQKVWQAVQAVWSVAPGWFGNIFAQIGGVFFNFGNTVRDALNNVITVIDDFLNAVNNSPLGAIGVHIGLVPHFGGGGGNLGSGRFAKGGIVPGGQGGGDTFPAMLTPGEVVLNTGAVRGLGGPDAANKLNHGMGGMNPGEWGGQCVVFLENLLGVHWPVAMASQLCGATTNFQPIPGEVAVFGGGPFGHVALVTGTNGSQFSVLDSNWVGPEIIGVHTMNTGMYGYCGAFPPQGAHVPAGLGGLAALWDPGAMVSGIISHIGLGGVAPWLQPATSNILKKAGGGVVKLVQDKLGSIGSWVGHDAIGLDKGGIIPPGLSMVNNQLGGPEILFSGGRADRLGGPHGQGGSGATLVFQTVGRLDPDMVREAQRLADWHARTGRYD